MLTILLLVCTTYVHAIAVADNSSSKVIPCPQMLPPECYSPNTMLTVNDYAKPCPTTFICADSMDDCTKQGCSLCSETLRAGKLCTYTCKTADPPILCRPYCPQCEEGQVLLTATTDNLLHCPMRACLSIDECERLACEHCKPYIQKGIGCNATCRQQPPNCESFDCCFFNLNEL